MRAWLLAVLFFPALANSAWNDFAGDYTVLSCEERLNGDVVDPTGFCDPANYPVFEIRPADDAFEAVFLSGDGAAHPYFRLQEKEFEFEGVSYFGWLNDPQEKDVASCTGYRKGLSWIWRGVHLVRKDAGAFQLLLVEGDRSDAPDGPGQSRLRILSLKERK